MRLRLLVLEGAPVTTAETICNDAVLPVMIYYKRGCQLVEVAAAVPGGGR